ncbi:hypothetical protein SNEBB_005314 [Seison nebaliae]|nr:hypothetical protein SNEBB_005314 [Seison nebaliae]
MDAKTYILKIELHHGSDRYPIQIYSNHQALVEELMYEVENKTRVPMNEQRLIFRGQALHNHKKEMLSRFGIFSGNVIMLIGQTLRTEDDEKLRNILKIEKDHLTVRKAMENLQEDVAMVTKQTDDVGILADSFRKIADRIGMCIRDLQKLQKSLNGIRVDDNLQMEERLAVSKNQLVDALGDADYFAETVQNRAKALVGAHRPLTSKRSLNY